MASRGRLTHPERRQDTLRTLVISHYEASAEFRREWGRILGKNRRLLLALARSTHRHPDVAMYMRDEAAFSALNSATRSRAVQVKAGTVRRSPTHLRRYLTDLLDLCDRWGLRAHWAPAWMHASYLEWVRLVLPRGRATARRLRNIGSLRMIGTPQHVIRIQVRYEPWPVDDWKAVEDQIVKKARQQRDSVREDYIKAEFVFIDTEPALDLHVRWLYLRISPQPDSGRPWGWRKIGNKDKHSPYTVRNVVLRLARELGITLPPLPPGRPRRKSVPI